MTRDPLVVLIQLRAVTLIASAGVVLLLRIGAAELGRQAGAPPSLAG